MCFDHEKYEKRYICSKATIKFVFPLEILEIEIQTISEEKNSNQLLTQMECLIHEVILLWNKLIQIIKSKVYEGYFRVSMCVITTGCSEYLDP